MELGAAFPAELLTAGAPQGGAAPRLQRRSGADAGDGAAVPAGFEWLLQMLVTQLPPGDPLPAAGNALPPAPPSGAASLPPPPIAAPTAALAAPAGELGAPEMPGSSTPGDDPFAALRAALGAAAASEDGAAPPAPTQPSALAPPQAAAAQAPPARAVPPQAAPPLVPAAAPADPAAVGAAPALPPIAADRPPVAELPPSAAPAAAVASPAVAAEAAPLLGSDGPAVARPRTRAVDALAPERLAAPSDAGDGAPSAAPTAVDKAAPLPPPAPAADAQAVLLRAVRRGDSAPSALPLADGATTVGAPLGHAAAHANGPAAPASAAPTAAAPASVPQAPVDTTAARWHEAFASRVHWLVDHDVGEARIRLNPPELGALDVKISLQDDKTFVQVTAHTAAARDELTQSLPRLRELLSAGGLDLGGATVSGGRDERAGRYAAAEPAHRAVEHGGGADPVLGVRAPAAAARSLVDLFA
jgi:flagellar hook-length control protein FliK